MLSFSAVALVLAVFINSGHGQNGHNPGTGMVEWLMPSLPSNRPQSLEQEERGRQIGRALPKPEILQPAIDTDLPAYRPREDAGKLSGSFKGACSDVLPDLVKRWITAFQRYYPDVKFDVGPPYAGSLGAQELVKSNLNFVVVSRELRPDDIKDFQAKFGYAPLSVPVSGGSYRHFGFLDTVAFLVNKENPIEKLSFKQLDAILSRTHFRGGEKITEWGQVGLTGDWENKPIHMYGIKPWNGYEEFIRQRVLSIPGKRGEWREDIAFDKLVFPVAGRVATDRYGIGYTGLAYLDAGVKVLPVSPDDAGPFYAPTYDNVAQANYPLARLIYFNTNKVPGKPLDPALYEFLRFVLSRDGQQIVREQQIFLPLRAPQADSSRTLLK